MMLNISEMVPVLDTDISGSCNGILILCYLYAADSLGLPSFNFA